jgi:hypothetical protein
VTYFNAIFPNFPTGSSRYKFERLMYDIFLRAEHTYMHREEFVVRHSARTKKQCF